MAKQMRKVRTGEVVSTTMDKTAVVELVWKIRHPIYRKQMRRVTKLYLHDPDQQCRVGDLVKIQETRPISKTKHWRLLEILQRRQIAEVQAIELEREITPMMTGEALAQTPMSASNSEPEQDLDEVSAIDNEEEASE
ncbi:MAG: 30S ribosomal protein S17 [SAR202 cluster bacterium]|jgi:small subunit ribosomal protein S17|nr:30S ribosomal protein S17 [Chloroflexota bacterium]MQG80351.1 30S ribosomal protein S17 [SAR202 cluster bacterium]|tara:strand:+ start:731 stop:1141 length:411 start_codon:yes stop_codon:yes gene_type:complete